MVEVVSGAIVPGIHYIVGNTSQTGTGTIVYNSITYQIGSSFYGQSVGGVDITTYSSTLTAKVYKDDTILTVLGQVISEQGDELTPYPESILITQQITAENFSDSDIVRYPEDILIKKQITADSGFGGKTQIIRIIK